MNRIVLLMRYRWWYDFREKPRQIRIFLWNRGLKLWWYRLWVRKSEFHKSLKTDYEALSEMNCEQRIKYSKNLEKRRSTAHKRDS